MGRKCPSSSQDFRKGVIKPCILTMHNQQYPTKCTSTHFWVRGGKSSRAIQRHPLLPFHPLWVFHRGTEVLQTSLVMQSPQCIMTLSWGLVLVEHSWKTSTRMCQRRHVSCILARSCWWKGVAAPNYWGKNLFCQVLYIFHSSTGISASHFLPVWYLMRNENGLSYS